MTRYSIIILAFLVSLSPSLVLAKRAGPAKVEPLTSGGVRYIAPNDNGRRGYIQAWDVTNNKLLWELTIYRNLIDPALEEDVQWVFIKKMSLAHGKLIVVDERERAYSVDLKTRAVKKLTQVSAEKMQANESLQPTVSPLRGLSAAELGRYAAPDALLPVIRPGLAYTGDLRHVKSSGSLGIAWGGSSTYRHMSESAK